MGCMEQWVATPYLTPPLLFLTFSGYICHTLFDTALISRLYCF